MALTFCCAILLLVGNLAGALHLATIEHAVCGSHGELVHADVEHSHGEAHSEDHRPALDHADDPSRDHEHCSTPLKHRERLVSWHSGPMVSGPRLDRAMPAMRQTPRAEASGARILLAPKNSPPA